MIPHVRAEMFEISFILLYDFAERFYVNYQYLQVDSVGLTLFKARKYRTHYRAILINRSHERCKKKVLD